MLPVAQFEFLHWQWKSVVVSQIADVAMAVVDVLSAF